MRDTNLLPDVASFHDAAGSYREQSYGIVRGLFSRDEITTLDEEAQQLLTRTDLIDTNNLRCRWQTDIDTDACAFDAFDPVTDLGPA